MFTDLVGSTALSTKLDAEDMRAVIGAYHRCVAETVARFDGFVAKYMGDGVLIYFGYPQAHEDDAERTVRAGLALVEAVGKLRIQEPLQVRIGVATGLVVVGDIMGSGEAQERGVVGEPPNLAARLQSIAAPNTIVIAEGTRRLIGNLFELEDVGAVDLKGIVGPTRAWAALRASAVESRFEALHATRLTAPVGREEEIELLLRRWRRAKSGEGQVVLLSGEPGVGKSHLVAAVRERLQNEPHTEMRCFCSPHHRDSALFAVINSLERDAGFKRDETTESKLKKLDALLDRSSPPAEDVPFLTELLSLPVAHNAGGFQLVPRTEPKMTLTPAAKKERTLRALVRYIEGLSRHDPVLIVFEDVQWVDPTSLELLYLVVERIPSLPMLLVVTFRSDFQPPWAGRPQVTLLLLNRLGRRDTLALVHQVVGDEPSLPSDIAEQIVDRADGVPLFAEELTKTVLEIRTSEDSLATLATQRAALALPATLHASLTARLDRLGPAKELAQIGAAIGREFSYELLAAAASRPETELRDQMTRLVASELVFQRGVPPDAVYIFKHALVQDAAYDTLLKSRRQELHARIGQVLETVFPDTVETRPELLAHHFAQAGLAEHAIEYSLSAGRLALTRSATTEAIAQLQKGLQLLGGLADARAREHKEIDLQIALGSAFMEGKGLASPEMGRAYHRAHELCRQTGDTSRLMSALWGIWQFHLNRAELTSTLEAAEDLLRCANDTATKSVGHRCIASSRCFRGEFALARTHYEQALALHGSTVASDFRMNLPYAPVSGRIVFAWALLLQGHPEQASALGREVVKAVRELNHLYSLAMVLHQSCVLYQLRGDRQAVEESSTELITLSAQQGFAHWLATGTIFQGWCKAVSGELETGMAEMRRGLAAKQRTGAQLKVPYYLGLMAGVSRQADGDGAIALLVEALARVEKTGERWFEAELHRLWGEQLVRAPNNSSEVVDAEERFRCALAKAREQQAKSWELRAATSLARLWRDQNKRTQAHDLLAPVYGWFTEGFDTPVLQDAKALLDQLA
jgi:predicted ATPase/class 3 adenylate cyclase